MGVTYSGLSFSNRSGGSTSSVSREAAIGAIVLTLMSYFWPSIFSVFMNPTSASLGRGIIALAEIAVQAGGRGGHDDASVALFLHDGEGRPAHVVSPVQMDAQHRMPVLRFHLDKALVAQDAGVVDQMSTVPKASTAVLTIFSPPSAVATLS